MSWSCGYPLSPFPSATSCLVPAATSCSLYLRLPPVFCDYLLFSFPSVTYCSLFLRLPPVLCSCGYLLFLFLKLASCSLLLLLPSIFCTRTGRSCPQFLRLFPFSHLVQVVHVPLFLSKSAASCPLSLLLSTASCPLSSYSDLLSSVRELYPFLRPILEAALYSCCYFLSFVLRCVPQGPVFRAGSPAPNADAFIKLA
jgi:hypothetical protein